MTAKGENNFKCRQCYKAFICQSNRNRHEKRLQIYLLFFLNQAYSETCQIPRMSFFANIINGEKKLLTLFAKSSILDD